MRALANAALLEAWEAGARQPSVERALSLLAAGTPEETPAALAALPIGARDARLLRLRELTFGDRLPVLAQCPGCAAPLEAELSANELMLPCGTPEPAEIELDGRVIQFRLPNSVDLAAVRGQTDAARALFARCVAGEPDEAALEAIAARMAELDPQSDLQVVLDCAECGHRWSTPFDIASYFWAEIDVRAQRLLGEVHQLARGYGWSERDILAMTAARRRAYLELLA